MKLDTFQSKRSYGKRPSDIKFDSDKFISAIQDVKQGVNERLRQWSEYETQLEKLINWLNDSESALKNYYHKSSIEEKQQQVECFKISSEL